MKVRPKAIVDPRDARAIVDDFVRRRPGFVPEWIVRSKSSDDALQWIVARYIQAILKRLNQAPDKNLLAFLDVLGIDLIPAQASRVPVVFQPAEGAADTRLPVATSIAAPPPPEGTEQIVFETEATAGITVAKLANVVSFWPGRDQYHDHSAEYATGQSFELFESLQDTPHAIYIAHDTLLAFAGNAKIDLEFELVQPGSEHLAILWQYWDGKVWRAFKDMNPACARDDIRKLDATNGLRQSGKIHLETDCAETKATIVNGIEAFWIRGRLEEPMVPDPGQILPEVDSIRLSSLVTRPLLDEFDAEGNPIGKLGMLPDMAFMETTELDLSQSFYPFGQQPRPGSSLYFSSEEIFGKPGARVTIAVERAETPQDNVGAAGPAAILFTFALPSRIRANGQDQSWIIVIAKDAKQRKVKDGTEITLSTTKGNLANNKIYTTNGFAVSYLVSNDEGCANITAGCNSIRNSASVEFVSINQNVNLLTESQAIAQLKLMKNSSSALGQSRRIAWEYWNGIKWMGVPDFSPAKYDLNEDQIVSFTVPADMQKTLVNDQEAYWIRVRLASGSFGIHYTVTWKDNGGDNELTYFISQPPALSKFQLGYIWEFGPLHAEHVLTFNDFQYQDQTYNAQWPGRTFQAFRPPTDVTPAVYLGFDQKLPNDYINLFFHIDEQPDQIRGPQMVWEYYYGSMWRHLTVKDETGNLALPGMVSFIAPADTAALLRFGGKRYWIRGRLQEDGQPAITKVLGLYPNAVWAMQQRSILGEPLGQSNGQAHQVFVTRYKPVLADERVEVQELAGSRAHIEWRILVSELFTDNPRAVEEVQKLLNKPDLPLYIDYKNIRFERDRNRRVTSVWVRWQEKSNLFFSQENDRHYIIDRALGRILFGDGTRGKIPPKRADVVARMYRTGGGSVGNVKAHEITQLLSGAASVDSVYNPIAAEGGADLENIDELWLRGPKTMRHRNRALTTSDFETMALEANPAVAVARALPTRDNQGRMVPGWITMVIIPKSKSARPWPSAGLRQHVQQYLREHSTADIAARKTIHVTGPDYEAVGVTATVVPVSPSQAGAVEARVRERIQDFLHPLSGGTEGRGWSPGRDVYLSDAAAVIENAEGVDYVENLALLQDGLQQGDRVKIASDRIAVAGTIFLKIKVAD